MKKFGLFEIKNLIHHFRTARMCDFTVVEIHIHNIRSLETIKCHVNVSLLVS